MQKSIPHLGWTLRFAAPICLVALWTLSGPVGCRAKDEAPPAADETTETEPADTDAASDDAKEDEGAPTSTDDTHAAAWTETGLRSAIKDAGWSMEKSAPDAPSVSTPDGTEIHGMTIERDDLRADVFLYVYPREGYATAHARAQDSLGDTAIVQRGARLIAVVGRDQEHARTVLEALPDAVLQGAEEQP